MLRHVLEARQFQDPAFRDELYDLTDHMKSHSVGLDDRRKLMESHAGLIVASVFYEPSTRTRLSCESAAVRLGMRVVGTENAAKFSSVAKGETLEDSTQVIAGSAPGVGYADFIVMRHDQNGAAVRAAAVSTVPIINAGDGTNEHPTQALLDMYTIKNEIGTTSNLHVVFGGDLRHGRTVRSLAQLLADPTNRLSLISPPELSLEEDVKQQLVSQGAELVETEDMYEVLGDADVVYWTRKQLERHAAAKSPHPHPELIRTADPRYVLGRAALTAMKQDAIILHPLPRVGEIETMVDTDPRGAYFRQADNGTFVRMALFHTLATERHEEIRPLNLNVRH